MPCSPSGWPEREVGFSAFVLNEAAETLWWDTANYAHGARPPRRGGYWWFSYARTLPGFPSFSEDHPIQYGEAAD